MDDHGREQSRRAAPVLALEEIAMHFGGIAALDGVSLTADTGEIVGLLGPNGAGKTTLFDVVSGVQAPTRGRVLLDGRDVTGDPPERRARQGVRRTFQRAQVYGPLTVEDNVLVALEWQGGRVGLLADLVASPSRRRVERQRRRRVDEVIRRCGLEDVRRQPAGALPIGLARAVELARAIVDRPRLLLLDEPTSGLAAAEAERFAALIAAVRDDGTAVVLVEHDVGFVMGVCDRVVVLDLGRVLADGSPAEVQADDAVRRAYLG